MNWKMSHSRRSAVLDHSACKQGIVGSSPTKGRYFPSQKLLSVSRTTLKQCKMGTVASWHFVCYWGRVTHICASKLIIIGSDNGLAPDRRQAIISTTAGILLIWPLGTNFSEIFIAMQKCNHFCWRKCIWKCLLWNGDHFVSASICKHLQNKMLYYLKQLLVFGPIHQLSSFREPGVC